MPRQTRPPGRGYSRSLWLSTQRAPAWNGLIETSSPLSVLHLHPIKKQQAHCECEVALLDSHDVNGQEGTGRGRYLLSVDSVHQGLGHGQIAYTAHIKAIDILPKVDLLVPVSSAKCDYE